jgi:hypothetical protein
VASPLLSKSIVPCIDVRNGIAGEVTRVESYLLSGYFEDILARSQAFQDVRIRFDSWP